MLAAIAILGVTCACEFGEGNSSTGSLSFDGSFSPGCMSYEGSIIQLRDGRFTCAKFTDQVVVDSDGKVVNQFPGYPKHGRYRIDGQVVSLETNDSERLPDFYLHRDGRRHLLLTGEQQEDWQESGNFAECALTLEPDSAN
jgi:hypothetical protein